MPTDFPGSLRQNILDTTCQTRYAQYHL